MGAEVDIVIPYSPEHTPQKMLDDDLENVRNQFYVSKYHLIGAFKHEKRSKTATVAGRGGR